VEPVLAAFSDRFEKEAHGAKRVEIGRTSPEIATILNEYGYSSIFSTESAP